MAAMASSDALQFAGAPETRLGYDGRRYTQKDFLEWYGDAGERQWADAGWERPSGSDALQPADSRTDVVAERGANDAWRADAWWENQWEDGRWERPLASDAHQLADRHTDTVDNAQGAAGSADTPGVTARLMLQHVIGIQQAEAARGPPRSLHNLARDALDAIANNPTQETVDLDTVFPWEAYVAAHRESQAIIGTGITHARAVFFPSTNDTNRGGAKRLDFCFYRTDGTVCRVHPGNTRKNDAQLLFGREQ